MGPCKALAASHLRHWHSTLLSPLCDLVLVHTQLWDEFYVAQGARYDLCVQLGVLLDVLNVFASINSSSSLEIRYPGPNSEVMCE